jgi:hypothetical protein
MKRLVLALAILTSCSVSFAVSPELKKTNSQQAAAAAAPSPLRSLLCAYNFSSGSNNSYLSYCVTVNGNVLFIETPIGHPQQTLGREGYGICNESPATEYHDYSTAGESFNWNAATLVSQTASSVKIARMTSDGNWTLTQTIIQQASTASVKVVMALKNNQAVAKVAYLVRYIDVDSDGLGANDSFAQHDGAFAWNAYQSNYGINTDGLQLQNVGTPPFGFWQAYAQTVEDGPNACAFAYNDAGQGVEVPYLGSLVMAYVGPVPAGGTKTVTLTYQGM